MEAKIKPQDLRIGNIIELPERVKEDGTVEVDYGYVTSIGGSKVHWKAECIYDGIWKHSGSDYEEIEPVELSEDWLIRIGYINNGQNIFDHPQMYFSIRLRNGKAYSCDRGLAVVEIKSVHHLQNLVYDLYDGSELTIKDINNIEVK